MRAKSDLVCHLEDDTKKGNTSAVFNDTVEATCTFHAEAGGFEEQIIPCETIKELVTAIDSPAAADHHYNRRR